jgi:hypothetical protein
MPPFTLVSLERFEPLATLGLACLFVIGPARLVTQVELLLTAERGALLGTDRIPQPRGVRDQRTDDAVRVNLSSQAERLQRAA